MAEFLGLFRRQPDICFIGVILRNGLGETADRISPELNLGDVFADTLNRIVQVSHNRLRRIPILLLLHLRTSAAKPASRP